MSLGGGTFNKQDKKLPGSYMNFISASRNPSMLSDRGIAAMPVFLNWGVEGEVFEVKTETLQKEAFNIFGYNMDHESLKGLRDLFKNVKTAYLYRLNKGEKAKNTIATAKYSGVRGNDIKIVIATNVEDETKFDVRTLVDNVKVDEQIVANTSELVSNNFVDWIASATLELTAGMPLTGGTSGDSVTGTEYQDFLDKIESYSFNTLGCVSTEKTIQDLFIAFTKRMRDEIGAKFQTVVYKRSDADYEGVISIENKVIGDLESSLVYWVTGISAGCPINKSNTNKKYDGEFIVDVNYTQTQLSDALSEGKFMMHNSNGDVYTLEDINTFKSFISGKGEDFGSNQTIRVIDQIAIDIASIFNTQYLGKMPNNDSGRVGFWNEIVKHHQELEKMQAIENFKSDNVTVAKGDDKKSIAINDEITPMNAMTKLYMSVVIN
jgi:hypothetical protein